MNIQPRFSGVYLEPRNKDLRQPSDTGHESFKLSGKSYYTTGQDTLDIRKAFRDVARGDRAEEGKYLKAFFTFLANKAPIPSLRNLAANAIPKDQVNEMDDTEREIYERSLRTP